MWPDNSIFGSSVQSTVFQKAFSWRICSVGFLETMFLLQMVCSWADKNGLNLLGGKKKRKHFTIYIYTFISVSNVHGETNGSGESAAMSNLQVISV